MNNLIGFRTMNLVSLRYTIAQFESDILLVFGLVQLSKKEGQ
jgi:hypothetical protein